MHPRGGPSGVSHRRSSRAPPWAEGHISREMMGSQNPYCDDLWLRTMRTDKALLANILFNAYQVGAPHLAYLGA
jgi:hypothetical protein